jgi:hypothetical protein
MYKDAINPALNLQCIATGTAAATVHIHIQQHIITKIRKRWLADLCFLRAKIPTSFA